MFGPLLGLVAVSVITAGAAPSGPMKQTTLTVTRLQSPPPRSLVGSATEDFSVIRDQAAWEKFWKAIHASESPPPAVPSVDFSEEMIAVAAAGQKASSGYSIAIQSATAGKGEVVITVDVIRPGPGCRVLQVITSPIDIVRVPRREAPVRFEVVRRTRVC